MLDKENEITAIPKLLAMIDLKGSTVTIDAIGCQRNIAEQIVQAKGNYILQVKDNQPTLHAKIQVLFKEATWKESPESEASDTRRSTPAATISV